jgi:3-oxoacyl-[acyl-carrier-protein] synthase-3
MAFLEIDHIRMSGITVCVPEHVEDNNNYVIIPKTERKEFVQSIGVEKRHVVKGNVCTSDLCQNAAEHLLKQLDWNKDEIELLVFVSQTPDYKMPATSCVLQHKLGLPKTCMCVDVSQGCSGFVYGLSVIGALLKGGTIKKGLLLTGNTQSRNLNYKDKSTWPLFGDAGSATAVEYSPQDGDLFQLSFMNDGSGEKTIIIPDGGYRNMVNPDSFVEHEFEGGIRRNNLNLFMQGDDVFAFVISNVPKASKTMFEHFEINQDAIDYYLIHHASKFIINKLLKKLNILEEKAPLQLKDFGNSSNVSIPLLMCTSIKDDVLRKRLKLYISGFGVGLSLGVGVITIGALECADLIEM